jgi:FMN-dependent NADH-azoreductase
MKKILHVISSPRGDASFSIKLGNAIVEKLLAFYPGSTVKEINLVNHPLPHLEESHITSFYMPEENRTAANKEAIKHSDEAIRDVMESDIIVIGAPMYNFNIHSGLKAWVDHIARAGVTFRYAKNGHEGLLRGKKVYVAIASGGIYSEGSRQSIDFIAPYLKTVLGFLGMTDVTVFRVEGTSLPVIKEEALEKAVSAIAL